METRIDSRKNVQFFEYTFPLFSRVIRRASSCPSAVLKRKMHLIYFEEYFRYFSRAAPLTIVVEWRYTDRDYLEDYAAYYTRCFETKYSPVCARLSFFRGRLTASSFQRAAFSSTSTARKLDLQERFIGFLVVRPLAHACIGRTCLRAYEHDGSRHYPVMRKCEAHVLGFDLSVQSLAWQEQDCAAAACATSALWSALHGTAMLFQHKVFSPVEITTIATEQFPGLRRAFPNRGLTPLQMAAAIRQAGLEPEVTGIGRKATLQATAHAYLRARIPLVLNVAMYDLSQKKHPIPYNGDWDTGHAVTITGFSMGNTRAEPYPGTGLFLRSSRIDKLYVHDDQVGPFARIAFGVPPFIADPSGRNRPVNLAMATSWRGMSGKLGTVVFEPETLIIPVYHKIRVDFHAILERILSQDDRFRRSVGWKDNSNALLEWDIFLTTVNEFKIDIRQQAQIGKSTRWQILTKAWPRYLWRAVAYVGSTRVFELLYDATDVDESHDLLIQTIYYDD